MKYILIVILAMLVFSFSWGYGQQMGFEKAEHDFRLSHRPSDIIQEILSTNNIYCGPLKISNAEYFVVRDSYFIVKNGPGMQLSNTKNALIQNVVMSFTDVGVEIKN